MSPDLEIATQTMIDLLDELIAQAIVQRERLLTLQLSDSAAEPPSASPVGL